MNLVLDFGNTRIKVGVFDNLQLIEKRYFSNVQELLDSAIVLLPIKNCLVSSVTKQHTEVAKILSVKFNTSIFTSETKTPLKKLYKSASTLGSDRIAASVGAYSVYPDKNILTIDAGTCIKYNFVNSSNEYLGGAISPGIAMRLRAMNEFTSALPLVEFDKNYDKLIGQSTSESILCGATLAAACEVDAMIARYMEVYDDLQVVLTGGDGGYLSGQLKNRFFANQNILLYGLNTILNYNFEK